jgi:hydroxymethylbilane synthase
MKNSSKKSRSKGLNSLKKLWIFSFPKEEKGTQVKEIKVGARSSPLSKVQVEEVLKELHLHHPEIIFHPRYVSSTGDKNHHISLRTLSKTDFFTKEIDEMVLNGHCRIGIHSAKDLPDPLPEGLCLAALTEGLTLADALVMKPGMKLETLPQGAIIATSSERREEAVCKMRADLRFIDIRGTIGQRLAKLEEGAADGVVIAEAALIRLGLTHLTQIRIPGETVPFQGQLAIISRKDDEEIKQLFSCIDSRKKQMPKVLYLGLNPPKLPNKEVIHFPIIKIVPTPFEHPEVQQALSHLPQCTHLLFTSQSAVHIFFKYLNLKGLHLGIKKIIAVGKSTARLIEKFHYPVEFCAKEESAEGITKELAGVDLNQATLFWPHSALSRPLLKDYFFQRNVKLHECILYDTKTNYSLVKPDLTGIDEIVFTSPSCVDAFLEIFENLPLTKKLTTIGPVTEAHLFSMNCG